MASLVNESITPQKVFKVLGISWDQGMLLSASLDGQDRHAFMQLVADYVLDKLKDLEKEIDAGHRRRKTGQYFKFKDITSGDPRYQAEFRIFLFDPYFGDEFDESFLRLRKEDGMLDIDLYIKPSTDPMDYFYTMKPERYQEEWLELEDALKKIKLVYTQGGVLK